MVFEFDPNKSASNKDKHGIDFEEAQALWDDDYRTHGETRSVGEQRFLTTGQIGRKIWTAVFTLRDDRIRLISVRRARDDEIERYQADNR
jgi:uncharacterized DUF497 family protein